MKDSSNSSHWFATRLLNAGSTTISKARQGKETPSSWVRPCRAASEHSRPLSSFSCHLGSPATAPSPLRSSLDLVIPFSWEKQPGVPKHCHHHRSNSKEQHRASPSPKLPLPPTLRESNSDPFTSAPGRKKRHVPRPGEDPFAKAMLECSRKDRSDPMEDEDPTATGGFCWKGSPEVGSPKGAAAGRRERVCGSVRVLQDDLLRDGLDGARTFVGPASGGLRPPPPPPCRVRVAEDIG